MRILIGFILALSVSFACDQPYEEVGGYKIGCPFEKTDDFSEGNNRFFIAPNSKVFFTIKKPNFFDGTDIIADSTNVVVDDKGIIQAVVFTKSYPFSSKNHHLVLPQMEKDILKFEDALNKKWDFLDSLEEKFTEITRDANKESISLKDINEESRWLKDNNLIKISNVKSDVIKMIALTIDSYADHEGNYRLGFEMGPTFEALYISKDAIK